MALRRRFGFQHGRITAFEDESLLESDAEDAFGHSEILEAEIERPRTGPMRDIVATIQPEQDLIVRAPLSQSVVVQGAPGTGKTAVGLHRAAYLLYAHRDQLSRSGVMVVGPNASFLSYIGDVLPALGEIDAAQETLESVVTRTAGRPVLGTDLPEVAVLKETRDWPRCCVARSGTPLSKRRKRSWCPADHPSGAFHPIAARR